MAGGKSQIRQQWADFIAKQPQGVQLPPPVVKPRIKTNAQIVNDALLRVGDGVQIPKLPVEAPRPASQIDTAKRGRHGERTTIVDGIKFRSKLEADRYRELKLLRAGGHVKWFLRQVPFDVSVSVVYRLDFLVCWNRSGIADEVLTYEETKGHLTDASRIKIGVVQERYAIKINILRRADVSR
jgi:hypothetical protein